MAGPGPQCSGRYPAGQCTAGAAVMFPIACSSPNLGNGGDWYGNAAALGWPHEAGVAHESWLASFNVTPPYGDVGLIAAINGDGTIQRFGANWHLDGQWSYDRVPADLIIGSFLPPGAFVDPTGGQLLDRFRKAGQIPFPADQPKEATGARGLPCQFGVKTPKIDLALGQSIGAQSICFDGLVGVLAWGLGAAALIVALVILARRPIQRTAGRTAETAGRASGRPEVAAAGAAVRRQGERPSGRQRARSLARSGPPQEQETYRDVRGLGYSPVQARRLAQAAGSGGSREERLERALRSAGT